MSSGDVYNCSLFFNLSAMQKISYIDIPFTCVKYSAEFEVILIAIFVVLVIGTAGGNLLVILSVAMVKKLQTASNILILNLAASDFLVSILVLPGAIYQQINRNRWSFSEMLCDIFISFDVLLCSSSILNLCAISIDRYLVITRPFQYAAKRTPARIVTMIAFSWLTSALISIPPMFGWKETFVPGECKYSENLIYQIYATFGAFYIPLLVMLILYGRIFKLARDMAHADAKFKPGLSHSIRDDCNAKDTDNKPNNNNEQQNGQTNASFGSMNSVCLYQNCVATDAQHGKSGVRIRSRSKSSETKAITTLGVIMGCFTMCWLPFFLIQIAKSVLKVANLDYQNYFPIWLIELCLWLGYLNSFLNPIIYAKFNREFRGPFKQILLLRCFRINARLRNETFAHEFGFPSPSARSGSIDKCIAGGKVTSRPRRRPPISSSKHNIQPLNNHPKPQFNLPKHTYKCLSDQKPITNELNKQLSLSSDRICNFNNEYQSHYIYSVEQQYLNIFNGQKSEKLVYEFGPASESMCIPSPPLLQSSSENLNTD